MTRNEWKQIAEEIEQVMAKHGYTVSKRRGTYGDVEGSFKIDVTSAAPEAKAKIDNGLNVQIGLYLASQGIHNVGNEPFIGRKVKGKNGRTYTIVGFNPRRSKYPLSIEGPQGGSFKCSASQLVWE